MQQSPTDASSRVLHITQPVDGGVARVVTDLVKAQLAAGIHVTVACPHDSRLADTLRALGGDVVHWSATRSPGPLLPREVRRLARVVAAARPDVLHAHSAKAGLAARLAVRGRVPTVFQPHAWSFEAVGGAVASLALRWERWGARWASRVVCVSEAERGTGQRAGVAARWSVIPNGVDLERFHPAAVDTVRAGIPLLARAGVDPAAPLVVCVGRLCPQKGQDVLLEAWGEVVRRVPEARLVLVGDGPDAPLLRALAPAGSVLFAGATDDAVPWYQAADLVVLPSRWEGMALAPLEAMACGRPVVMSDVDGAFESLPRALAPRCLVPPGDPEPLARAIADLLSDPLLRESLGHQGRRHVLATHDVRHTADAVAGLYRELLDARRAESVRRTARMRRAGRMRHARTAHPVEPAEHAKSAAPVESAKSVEHAGGAGGASCVEHTECRESIHT